jgi:phage terminase small subunit
MTNERQKKYVENRARGLEREASAILAGYPAGQDAGKQVEKQPSVAEELARVRAAMVASSGVTKEDIVQMLQDAALLAKVRGESMGLVAAARELGKMLGFYAPEVKKVMHGMDKTQIKEALSQMSDEELYKLAHARTLEGEFKQLAAPNDKV